MTTEFQAHHIWIISKLKGRQQDMKWYLISSDPKCLKAPSAAVVFWTFSEKSCESWSRIQFFCQDTLSAGLHQELSQKIL